MSDTHDRHPRRSPLFVAAFVVAAAFVVLVAYVALFGSADDGYPQVTMALPRLAQGPATPLPSSGTPRFVNGNLVADPALLEESPDGPLPKIGLDGRKPMTAYATPALSATPGRPRIAIVLTGAGVGANATTVALGRLPPAITFAVSPFAKDPQTWVDQARGRAHEVLVEIPMEPFDFPESDPGPRALLVAASQAENEKHLVWMLTRFTGYVGATNSQGGRFLSEAGALEPVIAFLAKRGLLWVDVSNGDNSATHGAAMRQHAVAIEGAVRLDAIQTADAIDARLNELEERAKASGFAVGEASEYPVSIDRIAAWAANVEAHGFALVPITAIAAAPNAPHP